MGFFDIFKRKQKKDIKEEVSPFSYSKITGIDGKTMIVCDYTDTTAKVGKLYDTTRLIVRETPTVLPNGEMVYTGAVSWYNKNDKDYTKNDLNCAKKNKDDYTGIQLRIDFNKLAEDSEYQRVLMTKLLDKNRVEFYILNGLQDFPQYSENGLGKPSGNYIGEICYNGIKEGYQKHFYDSIGEASHYTEAQILRRNKYKEEQKMLKKEAIEKKRMEIEILKKELKDLGEIE